MFIRTHRKMLNTLLSSYIQTAFSMDDAMKLVPVIEEELAKEENIQLDFSDVKFFTTLFFNNAITRYVLSLGPQKYRDTFKLFNLSDVGMSTYEHTNLLTTLLLRML